MRIFLLLLVVLTAACVGRSQDADSLRKAANEHFNAGRWEQARDAFIKLAVLEPENAGPQFRLGAVYYSLKDYKKSIEHYKNAIKANFNPGICQYNVACDYALLGLKDEAFQYLELARSSGFIRVSNLKSDEDLKSLRDDSRFQTLLERVENKVRAFKGWDAMDLWVGDWDVYVGSQKVGVNHIVKVLDGFAIEEHWTAGSGGLGKSLFTFDASKGQWKQLWIDDNGWLIEKIGTPISSGIRFEGLSTYPTGATGKARTTLTRNADGSVRQLIELQDAQGKWTTGFDGRYVRKGA